MSTLTDQLSSLMADAFAGTMDADAFDARLAEVDAALEDAQRYRWLERNCRQTPDAYGAAEQLYLGTYAAGSLASTIDEAMRAEAEEAANGR